MHPMILGVFDHPSGAAAAARALKKVGIARDQLSVVARNHDEEGALAEQMDATPGAEVEDSRRAARLGAGHDTITCRRASEVLGSRSRRAWRVRAGCSS